MFAYFKKTLYFPVASYFRFFAAIRLKRWNPKIIVVTGSNGKTTLLHLLESQIGEKARYSHHANSSYGIPFDILGLHRQSLLKSEWIGLILKAPFSVFTQLPKEKLYVVEADCDRPGEGKFLSELLKPEIVLWVSTSKTHSMNFEQLVYPHPRGVPQAQHHPGGGRFNTVEDAIAYEFGYFLEYARELVMIDGDSELMVNQISRAKTKVISIRKNGIFKKYEVSAQGTEFIIAENKYVFKYLLPEEIFLSIEMCRKIVEYLDLIFDKSFSNFVIPPGRGSIFKGIQDITIIDSSYNSNLASVNAVLSVFGKFPEKMKWVVIGDMLEIGDSEKEEHEKLAEKLIKYNFDKFILMGPRVGKFTFPKLLSLQAKGANLTAQLNDRNVIVFENPKETLDYLLENIKGGEIILFKGARFMEGIIERLLENEEDTEKLARREKIWEIRRKQWGL